MKDRKEEIELAKLINRRLHGQLDEGESRILGRWLEEGSNKRRHQKLISPQFIEEKRDLYNSIDIDQAYQKFVNELNHRKIVRVLPVRNWMRYAAIFLMGLSVASWYLVSTKNVNNSIEIAKSILPGSEKARLILGNGETIVLEKDQNMVIDIDSVIASKDNTLIYLIDRAGRTKVDELNTLIVPIGGMYAVTLSDGSKVWLNSKSSLTYPVQFGKENREVTLEGEGYFDVAKDKDRPFIVRSHSGNIEVLGTEFNVSDYPDETRYVATLVEGKVLMTSGANDEFSTVLSPGEQAVHEKDLNIPISLQKVDPLIYSAWKDGKFYFEDVPLTEILRTMGRWYNFDVSFENDSLGQIEFTGVARKNKSLHYLLDIISETSNTRYIINQNKDKYEVKIVEK